MESKRVESKSLVIVVRAELHGNFGCARGGGGGELAGSSAAQIEVEGRGGGGVWLRSDVIVGGGEWSRIWVGLRVRGGKGEGRERSWRRKEVPSSEDVGCKG